MSLMIVYCNVSSRFFIARFIIIAHSLTFSSQNLGPELSVIFLKIIHITEFKANAFTCKQDFYSTFCSEILKIHFHKQNIYMYKMEINDLKFTVGALSILYDL